MARKKQTRGNCGFCGREMTRGGLQKHLASCAARKQAVADVSEGKSQDMYHLIVRDAWDSDFWLHLEMRGSAKLSDLDSYLRTIWLECCGHMSQFSFGGWRGAELGFNNSISKIFTSTGQELTHIYDFGTSSETMIKFVSTRRGKPLTNYPIFLMARNNMPETPCQECGEQAGYLCMECQIEHEESGLLCEKHADAHPHDDYGEPMELLNSPRVGMCGDIGSAEPPY